MKSWFVIGIVASLLYGVSAIFFKLLTEDRFLGGRPAWVLAGIGTGIALCGLAAALLTPSTSSVTTRAFLWAVPAGLVNGFATLLVLIAMRSPTVNLSQLVPVYNTNTLIAFVLAILLFHELPEGMDLLRNLAGALLIVTGTILIGLK